MSNGKNIFAIGFGVFFVVFIAVFLGYYHKPLSMDDTQTRVTIMEMVTEENPEYQARNLRIEDIMVKGYTDQYDTETKAVVYEVITDDGIMMTCATVFELKNGFLKEKVGPKLCTIRDIVRAE